MVYKMLVRTSDGEFVVKYTPLKEAGIIGCLATAEIFVDGILEVLNGKRTDEKSFTGIRVRIPFIARRKDFDKGIRVFKEGENLQFLDRLDRVLWDGPSSSAYDRWEYLQNKIVKKKSPIKIKEPKQVADEKGTEITQEEREWRRKRKPIKIGSVDDIKI